MMATVEAQESTASVKNRQAQDQRLLERMVELDQLALSELYDSYHRVVYGLALQVTGRPADAEDVVAEVFWQVWQQAGRYDSGRGKVSTWLMTIARSRALDRRRRVERIEAVPQTIEALSLALAEAVVDPEEDLLTAERRARVRAVLGSLPEPQRQVIELAYYGGMTHSEIAAALNQPLGTVKTRIRTGLARLREDLKWCL